MQTPWYKNWFGKEYLELYSHRDHEEAKKQVDFILSQIPLTTSADILDIACGNGRHLIEFAKRGFKCTGNDLSKELIQVAQANAKKENLEIVFRNSDMRDLPFENQSFDLAISMFTSFGYFETDQEHIETLKEWNRVLKTGAYLFMDYLDKNYLINHLREESTEQINDKTVKQNRRIIAGRIVKTIEIADNNTKEKKEFIESVKLYEESDIRQMLESAGFSYIVRYTEKTIDPESSRLMLSARKN